MFRKSPVNENLVLARISVPLKELTIYPSTKEDQEIKFRVMNPTNHAVCFKIRSTRMEQLYMKPSFGVIQSNRAIYMRIKFRKLSTPKWDIKQDHLSIHFAVVPVGMLVGKPSDFWKNRDPSGKVLVHTINIIYGTPFEGMKGKKPEEIVGTTKKMEMDEEEHDVGAAVVLEKMDTTKP
ncbi:putative neuromodulin, partial [Trichinella spiralis]